MAPSILILGLAKTGTSALYAALKQTGDYLSIYEISNRGQIDYLKRQSEQRAVLAKVLLPRVPGLADELVGAFSRRVMIVRDPRDTVVSWLLYRPLLHGNHQNPQFIADFVSALESKERSPRSVPLSMLDSLYDLHGVSRRGLTRWPSWFGLEDQLRLKIPDLTVVRYEDYVDGRTQALEEALGLTLPTAVELPAHQAVIARSKSHGAWRHWFTEEDVDNYRPMFDEYLARHGYSQDWSLADEPRIDPATSSKHIRKNVAVLLERPHSEGFLRDRAAYTPELVDSLVAATEDGRERHMVELALAYRDGFGVPADLERAIAMLADAADRGNPMGLVNLGLAYRYGVGVRRDRRHAGTLFNRAAELSKRPERAGRIRRQVAGEWKAARRRFRRWSRSRAPKQPESGGAAGQAGSLGSASAEGADAAGGR